MNVNLPAARRVERVRYHPTATACLTTASRFAPAASPPPKAVVLYRGSRSRTCFPCARQCRLELSNHPNGRRRPPQILLRPTLGENLRALWAVRLLSSSAKTHYDRSFRSDQSSTYEMDKMLRFGSSTQLLSRCGNGWLTTGVAPLRGASTLYQNIRQVSTTRPKKAQATKEQVKTVKEAVKEAVEKKPKSTLATAAKPRQASTKTTATSSSDKASIVAKAAKPAPKTRTVKSASTATAGEEKKPAAPAKKAPATKASAAKTTAPAPTATATASATKAPGQATSSHTPTPTSTPRPTASSTKAAATPASPATSPAKSAPTLTPASKSRPASAPLPYVAHTPKPAEPSREPKPVDPSSPEYKRASRKWVSTMIALPILIVTSYFLFDRRT